MAEDPNVSGQDNRPLYEFDEEEQPVSRTYGTASMVLGIISVVCCCLGPIGLVLSILAIVFSVVDYRRQKRFTGMAIAGLVLGIVGIILGIYMTFSYVQAFGAMNDPRFAEAMDRLYAGDVEGYERIMNEILSQAACLVRRLF